MNFESSFHPVILLGLCTTQNKIHANIILAGDPKQLDAVTKSEQAKDLGFRTSYLEHLCERNLYKRNADTSKFNGIYITQLVRNYRSHPAILKLPNELFYENSLIAVASEGKNIFTPFTHKQIENQSNRVSTYRCDWLVREFGFVAFQTIPNYFQIHSILQC